MTDFIISVKSPLHYNNVRYSLSSLGMVIAVVTNYLVIYIRRRRIIIDYPNVKFYIVVLMYFNAMDWVSVGWLVNLSGAKPLARCYEFTMNVSLQFGFACAKRRAASN